MGKRSREIIDALLALLFLALVVGGLWTIGQKLLALFYDKP